MYNNFDNKGNVIKINITIIKNNIKHLSII